MRYSYLHPFAPQYFFQQECKKYSIFKSFYQPYTIPGAVTWWLLKNFKVYRFVFSKSDIEKYVPENHIRKILGADSIIAFNAGSPGPEQKITVIAIQNGNPVFLKYARTETAINLVENEYLVLLSLKDSNLSPGVIDHIAGDGFSCLKTEMLNGVRLSEKYLSSSLFKIIENISSFNVTCSYSKPTKLKKSFAHGDFCPWNLMNVDGTIKVFDWEMAGVYPLGYDLFTFIFQTSFLLYPGIRIEEIIRRNHIYITSFFDCVDWKPYLAEFATIKLDVESRKNNKRLVPHYKRLSIYAEKT